MVKHNGLRRRLSTLVAAELEPRLYGAIRAKVREFRGVTIAIGGTDDHLHLLCSFDPTLAVSKLVQQVKGASSHLMTHDVAGMESFKWQGAYGAFTVGKDALEDVKRYILDQKRHHAESRLWPEWEQTWLPDSSDQL